MKLSRISWSLLAISALLASCSSEDARTTSDELLEKAEVASKTAQAMVEAKEEYAMEAEAAADRMEAAFVEAYNAENAAGIAALFAEDGTIAPPGMMSLEKPGVATYYGAQFESGGDFTLEVEREAMIVSGDMSVAWGGFATSVIMEGSDPIVATGRYGVVSRREADGTWKIYRHMFNYITPPPEM